MTSETFFTVLMTVGIVQHMIWTYQLIIMSRKNDLTFLPSLFSPLHNLQNHRWSQLIVEVIQMTDIRLEIIQYFPDLNSCFFAVYCFQRICQFCQFRTTMEIHITCIGIYPVANTAPFMLHTEVLHLVSHLFQIFSKFKYVSFTSTIRIQKLIDHQYPHLFLSPV